MGKDFFSCFFFLFPTAITSEPRTVAGISRNSLNTCCVTKFWNQLWANRPTMALTDQSSWFMPGAELASSPEECRWAEADTGTWEQYMFGGGGREWAIYKGKKGRQEEFGVSNQQCQLHIPWLISLFKRETYHTYPESRKISYFIDSTFSHVLTIWSWDCIL